MKNQLFHVFRNTPFGRETLLQSIHYCRVTGMTLRVFIPKFNQFLMYFAREALTVDLSKSFLRDPDTAKEHAENLLKESGVEYGFFVPRRYTASTLPDIPIEFGCMCCPRSISDLSTKIGLGYIGPKVRSIVRNASFPVLIPNPVFKEWKKIVVFFGGSRNAVNALKLGFWLRKKTSFPIILFTFAKKKPRSHYEKILEKEGALSKIESGEIDWIFADKRPLRESLYAVPHEAMTVVGAYGHSLAKELLFGSMMEEVQTVLPNNMLIVGPNYREEWV